MQRKCKIKFFTAPQELFLRHNFGCPELQRNAFILCNQMAEVTLIRHQIAVKIEVIKAYQPNATVMPTLWHTTAWAYIVWHDGIILSHGAIKVIKHQSQCTSIAMSQTLRVESPSSFMFLID